MANKGSADMSRSHWNYRVVEFPAGPDVAVKWYQIYRVYYEGDTIVMCSASAPVPGADNLQELADELEMMRDALNRTILYAEDLPR